MGSGPRAQVHGGEAVPGVSGLEYWKNVSYRGACTLWINAVQIAMGLGLISRVLKKLILTILLVLVLPLPRSGFPGSGRSLLFQARWRPSGWWCVLGITRGQLKCKLELLNGRSWGWRGQG
ncbi:unnamed protein product [Rangifer tarandus platyrhynchus]|uniref:Uncharacterized protein n=1 Tax=Rangifer tarandus platyrhynchus TaxID=3082113 RepID=A0AC59YX31_RANTA